MKKVSTLFFFLLGLFVTLSGPQAVFAQDFNELYVPETGHWIRGKFLSYYQSVDDPTFYFGYPITDEFVDPLNGRTTQYFEYARFDLIRDGYKTFVKRAPLGELLYKQGASDTEVNYSPSSCKYYEDTGKYVCYAFLDFYLDHQEETILGYPISNIEWQEGRFVQYFEYARLEWHPALKSGKRVILSDLGKDYFNTRLGDPSILDPKSTNALRAINVNLTTNVFVQHHLIKNNEPQTLYIIVKNQHQVPVEGVMVKVTLSRENGKFDVYRPQPTDSNGISTLIFTLSDLKPNEIVTIQVDSELSDLHSTASGWYRGWW